MELLRNTATLLGNIIFPAYCMMCRTPVEGAGTVCSSCFSTLRMVSSPLCQQCGTAFDYEFTEQSICDICLTKPPTYDAARCVWRYDEYSAPIIKALKFHDKTQLSPYIAKMMYARSSELLAHPDTIIAPVPLHRKRLLERRYNQALLLAKPLAALANRPLIPDLLYRTRHVPPQTQLRYDERQRNVRDVFALTPHYASRIKDAYILIVDDVMTTGATVSACAETLKREGAAWVGVITIVKRIKDDPPLEGL